MENRDVEQQNAPEAAGNLADQDAALTTVSELDESELLQRIFPHLPTNEYVVEGPGDDCAVIAAPDGRFVVSTDILIENVHFRSDWSTGYEVGWRAAMQNLADIAAMGAHPTSMVVGLGMPRNLRIDWVEGFAKGLGSAARSCGASCVGGDLSGAPSLFVSVTVHGDLQGRSPVLRSGAQPGDVLALAGHTGWSAAGLELLSRYELTNSQGRANSEGPLTRSPMIHPRDILDALSPHASSAQSPRTEAAIALALRTFKSPTAPIALGVVASAGGATAMMDVSDGLIRDSERIARASSVSLILDYPLMARQVLAPPAIESLDSRGPSHNALSCDQQVNSAQGLGLLANLLEPTDSLEAERLVGKWMLSGGEDHALLATFPHGTTVPTGFQTVGRFEPIAHHTPQRTQPAQRAGAVQVVGYELGDDTIGWDHFR